MLGMGRTQATWTEDQSNGNGTVMGSVPGNITPLRAAVVGE